MDQGSCVSRPQRDRPAGALSWQHDEQRDNIKKEGIKKERKCWLFRKKRKGLKGELDLEQRQ